MRLNKENTPYVNEMEEENLSAYVTEINKSTNYMYFVFGTIGRMFA